jgi:hypothetical protein
MLWAEQQQRAFKRVDTLHSEAQAHAMKTSQILLLASLSLLGASCVDQGVEQSADQDDVSTTSADVTSSGASTQSACIARTPTTWVVNGAVCTYPWRRDFPLEIGESIQIPSYQGGGGYLDLYCDAQGLHLIEEVCSGTCELCL